MYDIYIYMSYVYTIFTYHAACRTWYILMYLSISSSNSRKKLSTSGQGTKSGGCDVDFERRKCSNKAASEHGSVLQAQVETNKMRETPWGRLKKWYDAGLNNAQRFRGYNKIPFGMVKKIHNWSFMSACPSKERRHFFSILDFPHAGSIHHWRWNHTTFPHAGRAKLGQSLRRLTYKNTLTSLDVRVCALDIKLEISPYFFRFRMYDITPTLPKTNSSLAVNRGWSLFWAVEAKPFLHYFEKWLFKSYSDLVF